MLRWTCWHVCVLWNGHCRTVGGHPSPYVAPVFILLRGTWRRVLKQSLRNTLSVFEYRVYLYYCPFLAATLLTCGAGWTDVAESRRARDNRPWTRSSPRGSGTPHTAYAWFRCFYLHVGTWLARRETSLHFIGPWRGRANTRSQFMCITSKGLPPFPGGTAHWAPAVTVSIAFAEGRRRCVNRDDKLIYFALLVLWSLLFLTLPAY